LFWCFVDLVWIFMIWCGFLFSRHYICYDKIMSNTQNQTKEQKVAEIQRHVRQHKIIALGLVAGTVLTIWASKMEFGNHSINIAIAMVIACTQAFLIVGFFMNLISEKKMIYSVVVFAAVFFVVQMGITLWARSPDNVVQMR